jgi:hypothetical protein
MSLVARSSQSARVDPIIRLYHSCKETGSLPWSPELGFERVGR